MYRNLGLDLPGCAKLLHVTERTLHNWQSGKHDIPFAAYKLLRLLNRMDLPGPSWAGWCFHGGKLWSPEGHAFTGTDSSWWSLLIRQARLFPVVNARVTQLEIKLKTAGATGSGRCSQSAQLCDVPDGNHGDNTRRFVSWNAEASGAIGRFRGFEADIEAMRAVTSAFWVLPPWLTVTPTWGGMQ